MTKVITICLLLFISCELIRVRLKLFRGFLIIKNDYTAQRCSQMVAEFGVRV